jgi:hypothetical protein
MKKWIEVISALKFYNASIIYANGDYNFNDLGKKKLWEELIKLNSFPLSATSFSGGRSQSTRREPLTMDKQLVNFITCGCESSAPFFVIYKARREPTPYWW